MPTRGRRSRTWQGETATGRVVLVGGGQPDLEPGPSAGAPLEPVVVSNKDFVANVGNVRENDVRGGSEFLDLVAVLHGTDEG